jgi:hypothetical protein
MKIIWPGRSIQQKNGYLMFSELNEKMNNNYSRLTLGVQCQGQIFDSCKISPNGVDQKNQFPARQFNEVKISRDKTNHHAFLISS